jgi:hypothetical protein
MGRKLVAETVKKVAAMMKRYLHNVLTNVKHRITTSGKALDSVVQMLREARLRVSELGELPHSRAVSLWWLRPLSTGKLGPPEAG